MESEITSILVQGVGPEQEKTTKFFKNRQKRLKFTTDFPVEKINPIHSFYAAVYRKDKDNYPEAGFQISNSLTRLETLYGMTIWGALANREENVKGSLEIGKYADIVILDNDLLKVNQDEILNTEVLYTIIDGKVVFQK